MSSCLNETPSSLDFITITPFVVLDLMHLTFPCSVMLGIPTVGHLGFLINHGRQDLKLHFLVVTRGKRVGEWDKMGKGHQLYSDGLKLNFWW